MKNSIDLFFEELPLSLKQVVSSLNNQNWKVGFVGGVVRDFLLSGKISSDVDIELRPIKKQIAPCFSMSKLQSEFGGKLNEEFNILSFSLEEYNLELSFPRIENYHTDIISHKNFSFNFSFGYEEEFHRRDLTINAIMFEFSKDRLVLDPLDGLLDLKNQRLAPCSENFNKDPVRSLRALRFSLTTGFALNAYLTEQISTFDVEKVSAYYLKSESIKSKRPLSFLHMLGIIEKFNEKTIYNNLEYSLKHVLSRSIELGKSRSKALLLLGESTRSILDIELSQSELDLEFYKKIMKQRMNFEEIKYIVSLTNLNLSEKQIKLIFIDECQLELGGVDPQMRQEALFKYKLKKSRQ